MLISKRLWGAVLVSALATWATVLAGCGGAACLRDSDCGSSSQCNEGACVAAAGKPAASGAAGKAGSSAGHGGSGGSGGASSGGSAGTGGVSGTAGRATGGMSGTTAELAGAGGSP